MPKVVYDKLNHHALAPTAMCLQLADLMVRYPAGIAENIPVKIWNFFIPVDFIILDMQVDAKTPLILGRPFLSTANAHIDVGAGEIQHNINGQQEKFTFGYRRLNNETMSKRSVARTNPRKRRRNRHLWTLKPSSHS